jgi:hypothetical protein
LGEVEQKLFARLEMVPQRGWLNPTAGCAAHLGGGVDIDQADGSRAKSL